MPAPLDVNWEALRTLAQDVGLREAARQCGVPEDAARQRSSRENWFKALPRNVPLPPTMTPQPVVTAVTKPYDVLAKYGTETRGFHAVAAHKLSGKLASLDEDELLERVPDLLGAGKHAALVHGWSNTSVNVGIRLDEIAKMAVSVEIPTVDED